MDSLNLGRALWRNRYLVGPVILLTVLSVLWVLLLRQPTYQVRSSVLLVPPPPAPTAAQVEKNPSLAGLNADNPYGRSYDPTVLIALVALSVTSEQGRHDVALGGGDPSFTVLQTTRYGFNSPFADITTSGASAAVAVRTNQLVIRAFQQELERVQLKEKVSRRYLITARTAGDPSTAQVDVTGTGRLLVLVLGGGVLGLFGVVSVGDAVRIARRQAAGERGGWLPPPAVRPASRDIVRSDS